MTFTELAAPPGVGRTYVEPVRTGIDEATSTRRIRLDAIARWLQDAAYWDLVDAGWDRPDPWFVRRLRLRVTRFPAFHETLTLRTWCSGHGPAVAERRTTIGGDEGAHVEAVAQWVHLDPATAMPRPLPEAFMETFGPSAQGRRSRTKLHHPAPPPGASARPFSFRAADVDPAAHVNNAAYWAVLEEELVDRPVTEGLDAEVEHRSAALPGMLRVLAAEGHRWVVDDGGAVVASFAVAGG